MAKGTNPNHILVIPDGNRRWAKKNGKTLEETYKYALSTVTTRIIEYLIIKKKIKILTIFIISRDNLMKRKKNEVGPILNNEINVFSEWENNKKFIKAAVKFRFIGDRSVWPKDYSRAVESLEKSTKRNSGPTCNLLAAYDGKFEIQEAIKKIDGKKIKNIADYLELKVPIDLIIRIFSKE